MFYQQCSVSTYAVSEIGAMVKVTTLISTDGLCTPILGVTSKNFLAKSMRSYCTFCKNFCYNKQPSHYNRPKNFFCISS